MSKHAQLLLNRPHRQQKQRNLHHQFYQQGTAYTAQSLQSPKLTQHCCMGTSTNGTHTIDHFNSRLTYHQVQTHSSSKTIPCTRAVGHPSYSSSLIYIQSGCRCHHDASASAPCCSTAALSEVDHSCICQVPGKVSQTASHAPCHATCSAGLQSCPPPSGTARCFVAASTAATVSLAARQCIPYCAARTIWVHESMTEHALIPGCSLWHKVCVMRMQLNQHNTHIGSRHSKYAVQQAKPNTVEHHRVSAMPTDQPLDCGTMQKLCT